MSKLSYPAAVLTIILTGLPGCVEKQDVAAPVQQDPAGRPGLFEDRLLEIARSYESYGRIDPAARWAPAYCAAPTPHPAEAAFSRSTDADTHGQKLYWLFARPRDLLGSYVVQGQSSPIGQVAVKEAWIPEEVTDGTQPKPLTRTVHIRSGDRLVEREDSFLPYARKGGRLYHAKERGPLFVMFKTEPGTAGTDEGWVYGTVTPDGERVTSAGRVESCMGCHRDAPHDRLFGLPEN
jgi:hypothetical protein